MKKLIVAFVLTLIILLLNVPCVMAEEPVVLVPVFTGTGINRYGGLQKGDVTSEVTVCSNSPVDAMMIAVLYERGASERIVDIDISCATAQGNTDFETNITVPDDGLYSLKIMCWDKDMNQLCSPFVLKDYNHTIYAFNDPLQLESFDTDNTSSFYTWADTEYGASIKLSLEPEGMINSALRIDYNRQHYGCQAQKSLTADWSGYSGMSFYTKDSAGSIVYLRINDGTKTWQYTVNPTTEWERVSFDFADLGDINLKTIKSYTFFMHSNGADDRSGEGYCLIDDIFLTSPVRRIMIGQITSKELGSCYVDSAPTLYAGVCNYAGVKQGTIKGEVIDLDGNIVEEVETTCDLESGYAVVPIKLNIDEYGVFKLQLSVNGGGYAEKDFARIPEIDNSLMSDEYKQGYSVHFDALKTQAQLDEEIQMLIKQGNTVIRQDFLWDIIEPVDGQYDWSLYDKFVNTLAQNNIEVLGLITYSNRQNTSMEYYDGAGKGNFRRYPPVDLEKWGKYVYDTVSRYKDKIHRWEIWNEANIFFWEQDPAITDDVDYYRVKAYLPLLKVSYLAAKAADPDCTVTMSGMSDIGVGFVNNLLEYGGKDYFDVLNIHPYMAESVEITDSWSDRNFKKKITHTRGKASDLPIYVTEWGWSINKGVTEKDRAIWNTKGIVYSRITGTELNTIYSFNLITDKGMGHIMPCENGDVTPQFAAVAASNYVIGSYNCVGSFDIGEDTFGAYFEKEGDKPVIALWLTDESITKTVYITTPSDVTLYDMYGNASTLTSKGGKVSITIDNKPVYIKGDLEAYKDSAKMQFEPTEPEVKNTKTIVQARIDYYFSTERIFKQGETYSLKIRITNYSGEHTQGTVTLTGIPQEWLSNESPDYSIDNGESAIVSVDITPTEAVKGSYKLVVKDTANTALEEMTYYFKGE